MWIRPTPRCLGDATLPRWVGALGAVTHGYGDDLARGTRGVTDDERAWGVAPWHEHREILHQTYDHDYRPRFENAASGRRDVEVRVSFSGG